MSPGYFYKNVLMIPRGETPEPSGSQNGNFLVLVTARPAAVLELTGRACKVLPEGRGSKLSSSLTPVTKGGNSGHKGSSPSTPTARGEAGEPVTSPTMWSLQVREHSYFTAALQDQARLHRLLPKPDSPKLWKPCRD